MYFSNLLARYCNRSTLLISSEEEENLANDRRSIFRHKLYVIFTMFLHNRKIITYFSYFSSSFFTIVLHFHDKITFKIARSRKKEKERKPRISRSSPHSLLIHWLTKRRKCFKVSVYTVVMVAWYVSSWYVVSSLLFCASCVIWSR